MDKVKELYQDIQDKVVYLHKTEMGFKMICKPLGKEESTVGAIRKWKKHQLTFNLSQSRAQCKISQHGVNLMMGKVMEEFCGLKEWLCWKINIWLHSLRVFSQPMKFSVDPCVYIYIYICCIIHIRRLMISVANLELNI